MCDCFVRLEGHQARTIYQLLKAIVAKAFAHLHVPLEKITKVHFGPAFGFAHKSALISQTSPALFFKIFRSGYELLRATNAAHSN
jgi:hypothetical protein